MGKIGNGQVIVHEQETSSSAMAERLCKLDQRFRGQFEAKI